MGRFGKGEWDFHPGEDDIEKRHLEGMDGAITPMNTESPVHFSLPLLV